MSCPFCLGPWVAGFFLAGQSISPSVTRTVATGFSLNAASNFLHRIYERAGE